MKITRRQLRRIIGESIQDPGDDVFIEAILFTWDQVRMDVDIPNPTYEDKVDEVWAMLPTFEPEIARQLSALSMYEQNILFQAAFDVGHAPRYKNPAVDWLPRVDEGRVVAQATGQNPVFAEWSADGLVMELKTPGGVPIKFRTQSDVRALITMLEELLAGPMRTSP